MRSWPLASFFLMLASIAQGGEPDFQSIAIFPTEKKHNHASCVVELKNGDLLAVWYSGSGERKSDDVIIQGAWLKKGQAIWGPRFTLADTPGYPDCNPAVFAPSNGQIWLFWPTILDHHWESALLKFAMAEDDGRHVGPLEWKREGVIHITPKDLDKDIAEAVKSLREPIPEIEEIAFKANLELSKNELYQRLGWMPRVHVLVLPSGRWLLPLYCDTFSVSLAAISDDQGKTWIASKPMVGFGNIQPSFVRKNDGTIVASMRENGRHQKIRQSESKDDGMTWSPVTDSNLPNPGAGIEAIRLENGHWAMIYNDSVKERNSLALSISDDEGATWKWTRHVEKGPSGQGSFHYPSLIQTRDGMLHVTYTHGGTPDGSTIEHARFNEEWVMAAGGTGAR